MKHTFLFFPLLAVILLTSCLKEQYAKAVVQLQVQLPPDNASAQSLDLTKVEVRLMNKSNPFTYSNYLDAQGQAVFHVQPGRYDLLASAVYESGASVNASKSDFLLTEEEVSVDLVLNVAIPNPLIIREFYYHGSNTPEGSSYTKDRYLEIFNNGLETLYLDSLCVTSVFPYNSTTGSNAWAGRDTIAAAGMVWMIPGTGSQYPLAPGEGCVLAYCAVDHTHRATSKLDLSKAHFGFYDDALPGHEIAAGVQPLIRIVAAQGTAWSLSIHSPALVIFRPEMGVTQYLANPSLWERYEPGKSSGTKYWHIAKDWIMDGVECVDSPAQSIKRLPETVDVSYVYMRSGRYSGKVVTRKVKQVADGRTFYQDTNNSAEDFLPDQEPAPNLKP